MLNDIKFKLDNGEVFTRLRVTGDSDSLYSEPLQRVVTLLLCTDDPSLYIASQPIPLFIAGANNVAASAYTENMSLLSTVVTNMMIDSEEDDAEDTEKISKVDLTLTVDDRKLSMAIRVTTVAGATYVTTLGADE